MWFLLIDTSVSNIIFVYNNTNANLILKTFVIIYSNNMYNHVLEQYNKNVNKNIKTLKIFLDIWHHLNKKNIMQFKKSY